MNKQERDKLTQETADKFVSLILVYAVLIEQYLTNIISQQFTKKIPDKTYFIEYFDYATFERKIQLVELILKYNYSNLFKDYENTLVQIKQIKDIRNRIAHHSRSYHDDGQKTKHVLSPIVVRLKKNPEGGFIEINVEKYTVNKMNGLMKMADQCANKVREMETKLK